MRNLKIRMLGGFAVEVDGEPVPRDAWERRRGADLVKLLALAPGKRLDRDRAVEALWPQLDSKAGLANLHKAATIARNALGAREAVVLRGGEVALAPEASVQTDLDRLEAKPDPALYRGELLPEDRYEEWTQPARERARALYLESLRSRGAWSELAAEDPADEEAQRELMRSLAARGNRHAALRQYRRLADALAAEGLRPDAETRALYEEVADHAPVRAPLSPGPALTGRRRELSAIEAALRRADGGRGGVLLVRGEAGAGKTRIAEEALARAESRGWTTLRGSGRSEEDGRPYGAVCDALDRMLAERPDLAAALPDAARAEIARTCPAIGGERGRVDARSDRSRIFAAIAQLLVLVARDRGVVLLIDDADRAGAATAELCGYLGAAAAFERFLLVLVQREGEAGSALSQVRGELLERGLAFDLTLDPLAPEEAGELVDAVARTELPVATREAILERAAGLPFFLIELAAAVGDDSGLNVPDHLYEVVHARLGRLEGPVRERLALIAAVCESFSADELIAIAACGEEAAFATLDTALAAGVLTEDEGVYSFRHALEREALARGVAAHRRAAAHRDAARRLAASGGAPARVADHMLRAGLEAEAAPWLERAAGEAMEVAAYADALELLERALRKAAGGRRPKLLRRRADALLALGDPRAASAYAEALAGPEARDEVELKVSQARALLLGGDVAGASAAVDGLEAGSAADRARLVFVRGMLAWFRGEIEEARRCAEEARPLAIEAQLPMEIEQSTQLHSAVAHSLGSWPGGLRRDLAATLRLPALAGAFFDAHHCWAEYELASGPTSPVREAADALAEEASRASAARAHAFAAVVAGEAELAGGELAAAERRLREGAELARSAGAGASEALARMREGEAALAAGDRGGAQRLLAEATEIARGSPIPHHLLYHAFAARIAAAEPERVGSELAQAESLLAGAAQCAFCPLPFNVAAARALAADGHPERASAYLMRAEAALPLWPAGSWPAALVAEARACIVAAREEPERAAGLLEEAVSGFEVAGRPLDRARAAGRLEAIRG